MKWKSTLFRLLKNYDEKIALECAEMSYNIYLDNCNTTNTFCQKSKIPLMKIVNKKNTSYIIYRGTHDFNNLKTNMNFISKPFHNTFVHEGFLKRFLQTKDFLYSKIKHKNVICCGHSLGAAVTSLAALDLSLNGYNVSLYTFGSPQVGDANFKNMCNDNIKNIWRFVNSNDVVVRIIPNPYFFHIGNIILIKPDTNSTLKSHKMEHYLHGIKTGKYDIIRYSVCKSTR